LYGTTTVFLRTFGLETIDELDEVPELAMFSQQIKEQRRQLLLGEETTKAQKDQLSLEAVAENDSVADVTATNTAETPFEVKMQEEKEALQETEE
ncbi:MAG: hypothetical protein IJ939_04690, partial [Clostridia bacterium]|nr:hypothetical protein [Clostridia bacterium]